MGFTSLAYHLDLAWLREAFRRTRKDGAAGVDGQTAGRVREGPGGQPPVAAWTGRSPARTGHRRCGGCTSPKGSGAETRPIGIPTLEDKVLQRAVVMLLEPIYEQDFHDCSYGFRPRTIGARGVGSLWKQTMGSGAAGSWRWTSASFSTRWIMPTCGSFSNTGYATACCYD